MDNFSSFKEAFDYYLEQKGHTQAYVARTLRYKPPRFNKWIMQENKIPYQVVNEICALLKLERQQEMALFALAGYPLPSWVGDLLAQANPFGVENEYAGTFAPSIFGEYEGESYQCLYNELGQPEKIPDTENVEDFSIIKTIGAPIIKGTSFKKTTGVLESKWQGRLWNVVNGTTLYFGVDLKVDIHETAIWVIDWSQEDVEGWFYSGRGNQRFSYRLFARKKRNRNP